MKHSIYLDNATTSFPKPPQVYDAVDRFLRTIGASDSRSAHRLALEASRIVFTTRERLASLFHVNEAARIVFTLNATEAINTVLFGFLREGDAVLASSLEHNAVMRPLRHLQEERRIAVSIIPCTATGVFDLSLWESALQERPRLAIVNHGSNVIGTLAPLSAIGELCRHYGVPLFVDAAQTAGIVPIDVGRMNIAMLAFSGHKGLFGIQGTGGLYIRNDIDLSPLKFGGTGSNSESDEQPRFLPDRFESGTLNMAGIASLEAGVAFVQEQGGKTIFDHGRRLTAFFLHEAPAIPGVTIHGPQEAAPTLPTVSMSIDGTDNGIVAQRLNDEYDIAVRVGLQCAPLAHRTIGTFPAGTLRVALGYFTTEEEVKTLIIALKNICHRR